MSSGSEQGLSDSGDWRGGSKEGRDEHFRVERKRERAGGGNLIIMAYRDGSPQLILCLSLKRTLFSFSIRNGASSVGQTHLFWVWSKMF